MKSFKVTYFSCKVLLGINGVKKDKDILPQNPEEPNRNQYISLSHLVQVLLNSSYLHPDYMASGPISFYFIKSINVIDGKGGGKEI